MENFDTSKGRNYQSLVYEILFRRDLLPTSSNFLQIWKYLFINLLIFNRSIRLRSLLVTKFKDHYYFE